MPESLRSEALIYLFGRAFTELTLVKQPAAQGGQAAQAAPATPGLRSIIDDANTSLARIYSFSFQGQYFELASPALFIVRDQGKDVLPNGPLKGRVEDTGLASLPPHFATDLKYWTHERGDLTVRLDITAGAFSRVLLEYELADDGMQTFVRGGGQLGTPTAPGVQTRRRPRWRSDED